MLVRSKLIAAARVILAAFLLMQASFAMSCVITASAAPAAAESPCHEESPAPATAGCAAHCFVSVPSAQNSSALDMRNASPVAIVPATDLGIRVLLPRYTAPMPMAGAPPPLLPHRILLHSFLI